MISPATLLRLFPAIPGLRSSQQPLDLLTMFSGFWSLGDGNKRASSDLLHTRCNVLSKTKEVFQNGLPMIKWQDIFQGDKEREEEAFKASSVDQEYEIEEKVEAIRSMLNSMDDGEISISAYDTAWVALVRDVHGSFAPQFPSSLQWIINNQLPDGSWGDRVIFSAHDRIISTLACVIALKSWKIHPGMCEKGMSFLRENMCRLDEESAEHMSIGFEVAFPSLIELARNFDLDVPEDSPALKEIYARRNLKFTRIPRDMMHIIPTTLLHSLEGIPGLDWQKLLKLQCTDGSFLFSPASTAFALMETKDEKCLTYLTRAVERFNGGVPNVYPIDLFEHIWAVDRLERLGISRYFEPEIKECLDYVNRYWTEDGICWARNSPVHDIDDTAMAFRLLRLRGTEVSADVFQHFQKGGEFFCFTGQSNQAVTGMFNLYRASQLSFPGEKILEEAKTFSLNFLREKQACNQLLDKWIINKDLPGEVGYALNVPWYASLPRIETRFYIDQYGAEDDIWIGKTLYRVPFVNNKVYLELAKLDFNDCQALHQLEWVSIQKWYEEFNLRDFGMSRKTLLRIFFLAAASIFEPERSTERLAWARTAVLVEMVSLYFDKGTVEQRRTFIHGFRSSSCCGSHKHNQRSSGWKRTEKCLVEVLLRTLNQLSLDALVAHGRDISHHLRFSWEMWLLTLHSIDGDNRIHGEAELLVRTISLCAGRSVSQDLLSHSHYQRLSHITNSLYHQLRLIQKLQVHVNDSSINLESSGGIHDVESDMQELVKYALNSSDGGIDRDIKQTFLTVAKSFYYNARCSSATINLHIAKVLFERVL